MINWNGNSGGAVAFITLFLCVMAETWILGEDTVDMQAIIEAQKSAIEWDRTMVRHYGEKYREQVANPDSDPDFQEVLLESAERNARERRERAEALAQGLAILERKSEVYEVCQGCGNWDYLWLTRGKRLCPECDLKVMEANDRPSDDWDHDHVSDADYPAVEEYTRTGKPLRVGGGWILGGEAS
ncbi:hypothetical protein [Marinobacter sp. LN3S78]|uniref:hypothetical protein n=1 Tax=Marinobacter sp. LN3S78 TaxID=3382300 RepID=UPI00387B65C4